MLMSISKGAAAFAAIISFSATSVQAETHNVLILEKAYFPAVTYVKSGDTIVFSNLSGIDHLVSAKNDAWTTGLMANGTGFSVSVQNDMQASFSGVALDNTVIEGNLNFQSAPLD